MSSAAESVLVVEDEPSVRALVHEILQGEGYRVIGAASAWEALGVAETQPICLLLTDVLMPEMDGCELARRIETIRPAAKVLFMSASDLDAELGPNVHFIAKPFQLDHIVSTVGEVLAH
jgi:CheY-like chemotaxis protein